MAKTRFYRFLEIMPGVLTWSTFILPILLSYYFPSAVAIFIIAFTLNWLFRSVLLAIDLVRGYLEVRRNNTIDWSARCRNFDHTPPHLHLAEHLTYNEVLQLNQQIKFQDLTHVIIFVTYKEPLELLRQSLDSYVRSHFPVHEKLVFVLAGEERDAGFPETARILKQEYADKFLDFLVTVHPKDLPNEVIGKAANTTWAAKQFRLWADERKLNYEHILLHNFDADTVVHPQYFSEISFRYLITPNRTTVAFQPFHLYHNNIWEVPIFVRLVAFSCSFWKVAESQRRDRFRSFSSRSNPFQMIVDVNYWDPAIIPEDSRQYWTAWLKYKGKHDILPLYSPLYMDAVQDATYWKTLKAQYAQLHRWSWGVTDVPWLIIKFWQDRCIPWYKKAYQLYDLIIGHWYWGTAPFLLTFSGYIPSMLNSAYRETILATRLPGVISNILTLSSVGILICIGISFALVPRPQKRNFLSYLSLVFQWVLIPFVSILLSAIPAIQSQTELMFGKYLEYKVTPKVRKDS